MREGQKMAIVPHFMYLLKIVLDGGWVVQKDKIPLRNIKMVSKVYVAKNCCTFAK